MKTYKDLVVWQKATALALAVYKATEHFPKSELWGLTSQMRRASVSIASNIAEGKLRGGNKEWRHFLCIAFGSGGELETQLHIAKELGLVKDSSHKIVSGLLDEVMRMLNVMITKASEPKLGPKA